MDCTIYMDALPTTVEECHKIIKFLTDKFVEFEARYKKLEIENAQLKEQLNNNSSNSSKPPSSDFKKKKRQTNKKSSGKKSGGQKGHKGSFRVLLPTEEVDDIVTCKLPRHCSCGGKIKSTSEFMRHQVHELPVLELNVTEYQLQKGFCSGCKLKHISALPNGVTWGITGSRLTSFMSELVAKYGLSRREQQRFLKEHFNFHISLGTVFNKQKIVNAAMETPVEELLPFIKQSHSAHADETGHKRDGKNQWVWGFMSQAAAYFKIHASRGIKALREMFGDFKNIVITDRYAAYNIYDSSQRQICWAHIKRDFTKLSEKKDKPIARIGKNLLESQSSLFYLWHQYKDAKISKYTLQQESEPIRKRIGELLEQGSYTDPTLKAAGFCKNLLKVFNALWTFLEIDEIEPTNNHAERSIRPIVIWRKKYFGTRSDYGSQFVARSASVNMTCKFQERNSFTYLCDLMKSYFAGEKAPSLLPSIG